MYCTCLCKVLCFYNKCWQLKQHHRITINSIDSWIVQRDEMRYWRKMSVKRIDVKQKLADWIEKINLQCESLRERKLEKIARLFEEFQRFDKVEWFCKWHGFCIRVLVSILYVYCLHTVCVYILTTICWYIQHFTLNCSWHFNLPCCSITFFVQFLQLLVFFSVSWILFLPLLLPLNLISPLSQPY